MIILLVCSRHNYGDARRGVGTEYANFIPALRGLGHEVFHFDSWERARYRDFGELNQDLLRRVDEVKPDVVFSVQTNFELWSETWLSLRRAGGPILINWGTDDSWRYPSFSRFVVESFDAYVTTSYTAFERLRKGGHDRVFLSQWAVLSTATTVPLVYKDCTRNVSFIGTARPARKRWIQELGKRGVEVDCFGHGFPNGSIAASDIPRLMRESRLSINFADSVRGLSRGRLALSRQLKSRVFEVAGASTLLLTEPVPELAAHYQIGSEIDVFTSPDQLAERIGHYLANPDLRDAVAYAGYRRTVADHTYERRFEGVIQFAVEKRAVYLTRLPKRDNVQFDTVVSTYRSVSPLMRLLGRALTIACRMVWGPIRGPRAARRIAFEISWRVAGGRTYSALGLPGRLFYDST
jgi:spore maturation protein CgeB